MQLRACYVRCAMEIFSDVIQTVKVIAIDDTDKDGNQPTEAAPSEADPFEAEREVAEREATTSTMQRLLELFQRIDTAILEVKYDQLKAEVVKSEVGNPALF